MRPELKDLQPTDDPSIFTKGDKRYHVPRTPAVKIATIIMGILITLFAIFFARDPLGRMLFGETAEARIVRIVKHIPGGEDEVYRYRREFEDERDRSISFQHYAQVNHNGDQLVFRLGVDSRVKPYVNVNDRLTISFYPDDEIAFAVYHLRSWGMALLYGVIGLIYIAMGIPMLLAVGKPIEIDPEAPVEKVNPGGSEETNLPVEANASHANEQSEEPETGKSEG